jgi:hypothetical protein
MQLNYYQIAYGKVNSCFHSFPLEQKSLNKIKELTCLRTIHTDLASLVKIVLK